jgi:hypothetical protein
MAYFVWHGASAIGGIDANGQTIAPGANIVVLASKAKSPDKANSKTGDMWQFYILAADILPTDAKAQGLDATVCGNCVHRKVNGNTCYTYGTVLAGANGMWRQWRNGNASDFAPDMVAGSTVRLGAYGDPCAVPYAVWEPILAASDGWTAYSHQWANPDIDARFKTIAQASADTAEEIPAANAAGWRAYTVMPVGTTRVAGAVPCPSPRIACADCLKCSGTGLGRRGNVWIAAHGARAKSFVGTPLPLSVN